MHENIAVIGGGLTGCLTALMLARQKNADGSARYRITIIESRSRLLGGASLVGFRLHLGGEYVLDSVSMQDCITAAVVHRLLMPETIYTLTPGMQFLIAQETQKRGTLTGETFQEFYENNVRKPYEDTLRKLQPLIQGDANCVFGPADAGVFFYRLAKVEYEHHQDVVAPDLRIVDGFQTSEPGIHLRRFHKMISKAVKRNPSITVLLKHTAKRPEGTFGQFTIPFEGGQSPVRCSQIVQSAWEGGPALTPLHRKATIYRRAILRVRLPEGPYPPVFVLHGEYGGMFAPESDTSALVYLPKSEAGWIDNCEMPANTGEFPGPGWYNFPGNRTKQQYRDLYFRKARERFPRALRYATDPELIVRETVSFDDTEEKRRSEPVEEVEVGKFVLYSTKATYAARLAVEAADMVQGRSDNPAADRNQTSSGDTLNIILSSGGRERYSLAYMDPHPQLLFPLFRGVIDPADELLITEAVLRDPFRHVEELNAARTPFNILNAEGRFVFVNAAYAERYPHVPKPIEGQLVEAIVGPEGAQTIRAYTRCALQGSPIHYRRRLQLPRGDRDVQCVYVPVRDPRGWLGAIRFLPDLFYERPSNPGVL